MSRIKANFRAALSQWRAAGIVYFISFCLALTLGMQVFNVLEASIGQSLEVGKLMAHYDHTVLSDFLKVHGASITPLLGQLRWLILVWLVFSIFLDGGLLSCAAAAPAAASGQAFWSGAARWFFPFLKIVGVFLVLAAVWSAVVLLPVFANLEGWLRNFSSEKYAVWIVLAAVGVWLAGMAAGFVWSVLSRLEKLKNDLPIWASIRAGGRVFLKNWRRIAASAAAFFGSLLVLVLVYFLVEAFLGMTSPLLILLIFGVQQLFVFLRILVRQVFYVGLSRVDFS